MVVPLPIGHVDCFQMAGSHGQNQREGAIAVRASFVWALNSSRCAIPYWKSGSRKDSNTYSTTKCLRSFSFSLQM